MLIICNENKYEDYKNLKRNQVAIVKKIYLIKM